MIPFFDRYKNVPKAEIKELQKEVEQLQSDDDYVKGLALENKELIEQNRILIDQILQVIEIAQANREGVLALVQLHSENINTVAKKITDIEKALKIMLG